MLFSDLSFTAQTVFHIVIFVTFAVSISVLLHSLEQKNRRLAILSAVSIIGGFFFYQLSGVYYRAGGGWDYSWQLQPISPMPLWLFIAIFCVYVAVVALLYYQALKWDDKHISTFSVKDGMDNFPEGICYYKTNTGLPLLVNFRMYEICKKISGKRLTNPAEFFAQYVKDTPVFEFEDGTVFLFQKNDIVLKGHRVTELIAIDITKKKPPYKKAEGGKSEAEKDQCRAD